MRLLILVWTSLLCRSGVAYADAKPGTDPDTEVAQKHFVEGVAHYGAHRYDAALKQFELARLAKPLPAFDFNIARCFDRLEHYPEAIHAYERYIADRPDPEDIKEARERIVILRRRVAALQLEKRTIEGRTTAWARSEVAPEASTRAGSSTDRDDATSDLRVRLIAPLVIAGGSLILGAMGLGFYVSAHESYDTLAHTCAPGCAPALWSGLDTRERLGVALLVAAGATAIADGVLWGITLRRPARSAHAFVVPSPMGVAIAGAF